jgi:hypothetical protein
LQDPNTTKTNSIHSHSFEILFGHFNIHAYKVIFTYAYKVIFTSFITKQVHCWKIGELIKNTLARMNRFYCSKYTVHFTSFTWRPEKKKERYNYDKYTYGVITLLRNHDNSTVWVKEGPCRSSSG